MTLIRYNQYEFGFSENYSQNACGAACICSVIHSLKLVSPNPSLIFDEIKTTSLSPRFGAALHKMANYLEKYGFKVSYSPPINYDPISIFMLVNLRLSFIRKTQSSESSNQDQVYYIRLLRNVNSRMYYHYIVEDNSGFYMCPASRWESFVPIDHRIQNAYGPNFVDTGLSLRVSLP